MILERYRGQWGGKIDTGEEMWWSEPNSKLAQSTLSRFLFRLDVRQHFILRFWKKTKKTIVHQSLSAVGSPSVVDYGCGTGGTTLNFSSAMGVPILGVDVFPTQIQIAKSFSDQFHSSCTFDVLDGNGKIPVQDQSLDAILSLDVLGHVPNIPNVLREFYRALKPGGSILLFTESNFSPDDRSWMAYLAKNGFDMVTVVPEHISLYPKEVLEKMFNEQGFEVLERYSANIWHFFFFPKDYVLLLKGKNRFRGIYFLAFVWNRISKVFPFYPWPFQFARLALTYLFGKKSTGTSYFYHLRKVSPC